MLKSQEKLNKIYKDREKIFERFHRVDNSLNRKNEGCGIGLFLCRKFIEMHGGEIFLDNIDNGTQFSFYLPINITEEKINNPIITVKKVKLTKPKRKGKSYVYISHLRCK